MPRKRVTTAQRNAIAERAGGRCEYCRSSGDAAMSPFEVDHIMPVSRGEQTILENLAWACRGCNLYKHDKTEASDPAEGTLAALFNPRHQKWKEHFRWSEDFTHIIGITPTGRATVEALQMNRQGLVNLRQGLFILGKHPPDSE